MKNEKDMQESELVHDMHFQEKKSNCSILVHFIKRTVDELPKGLHWSKFNLNVAHKTHRAKNKLVTVHYKW